MQRTVDIGISPINYNSAYEVLDENETKRKGNLQYTLRKLSETTDLHPPYLMQRLQHHIVHSKSHSLISAEMEICDNLPEPLAQEDVYQV